MSEVNFLWDRQRQAGEWVPNQFGGNHNLEAVEFLKRVTRDLANPYIVFRTVIAEAMRREEIPSQDVEIATSMVTGAVKGSVSKTSDPASSIRWSSGISGATLPRP